MTNSVFSLGARGKIFKTGFLLCFIMFRLISLLLICSALLFPPLVSAAVIEGDVYSIYLELLDHAVISIDTVPQQVVVAKEGHYAFTVPPGDYVITAEQRNGDVYYREENVTVAEEGTYTLDLLLDPLFEEPLDSLPDLTTLEDDDVSFTHKGTFWLYLVLLILLFIIFTLLWTRKRWHHQEEQAHQQEMQREAQDHELGDDLDEQIQQVLAYLKTEGGRAHQKAIRKHFSMSEAKLSLLIADMEHRGMVKKIKKGRGNIIVSA